MYRWLFYVFVSIFVLVLFLISAIFIFNTELAFNIFKLNREGQVGVYITNLLSDLHLNSSNKKSYREFFRENAGKLKDEPRGQYVLALGLSLAKFDDSVFWNYKLTPFWATIDSFDPIGSYMEVTFLSPKSMPYINQSKSVRLVGCEKHNSFLTIANPQSIQKDVNIYTRYVPGDQLISFCLDQECTEVGLMCKLYRENTN